MRALYLSVVLSLSATLAGPALASDAETRRAALEKQGAIRRWRKRSWDAAYTYHTRHYEVRTTTSHETAKYIGTLMELMAQQYRVVFGYRFGHIPRLPIHAYAVRDTYDDAAEKVGMPRGVTCGFFSPKKGGAIHLPFIKFRRCPHPSVTLFHEGTHQFVHEAVDFKVPFGLRHKVDTDKHVIFSVPLWLNEGLATYMETGYYNGETIEIGRINEPRLRQLQTLLKRKNAPSVREVVSAAYGRPFNSTHYAVAWGLVYCLRHHRRAAAMKANRQKLITYLKACKRAFYHAPQMDFGREWLADGELPRDFGPQWNQRIGKESLAHFEKTFLARGQSLDAWEAAWAEAVLDLDPRRPYGGTATPETAADSGDARLH